MGALPRSRMPAFNPRYWYRPHVDIYRAFHSYGSRKCFCGSTPIPRYVWK